MALRSCEVGDDGGSATIRNGIMALARVIGAVCGDAADLLVRRDLTEQVGQNRCIADVAPGDLNSPDLQCFLVDPEVDLAPDATFWATMLAGVPFAFALDLDALRHGPRTSGGTMAQCR